MTEYVTVKISGTFPAEDINILASFYSIGNTLFAPVMGLVQEQKLIEMAQEQKLEKLVEMAQNRLADFLSAATKNAINKQAQEELRDTLAAVDTRVKSALTSEIITTEA